MHPEDILAIVALSSHRLRVIIGDARSGAVIVHKDMPCRWHDLGEQARLEAMAEVLAKAEDAAGLSVRSIFLSRSDTSLASRLSTGHASLGQHMVIRPAEKAWAIRRAREQATGIASEVIMAIPVQWRIRGPEGEGEVEEPLGEQGSHLSCQVLLVTARPGYSEELRNLGRSLGRDVEAVIPPPVALWRGISGRLLRRGSSLVIDLGARHTTILVQRRDRFVHLETRGWGGDDLTRIVAEKLDMSMDAAQALKHRADLSYKEVDAPGQQLLFSELAEHAQRKASHILSNEVDRWFGQLAEDFRNAGHLGQQGCLHLVGQGAALGGLPARLGEIFGLPVRLGSGGDDRDPAAELDGLMIVGQVLAAADLRQQAQAGEGPSIARQASGLWSWLTHRYQ